MIYFVWMVIAPGLRAGRVSLFASLCLLGCEDAVSGDKDTVDEFEKSHTMSGASAHSFGSSGRHFLHLVSTSPPCSASESLGMVPGGAASVAAVSSDGQICISVFRSTRAIAREARISNHASGTRIVRRASLTTGMRIT